MRLTRLTCLTLLAYAALASSCSKKPAVVVLARVGQHAITADDFLQEIKWRQQKGQILPEKQVVLDQMVARELRLQRARALGLDQDLDVRHRYESILVARLDERELLPQLEAVKVPPQEVSDAFQKEIARYTHPEKIHLALVVIKTDSKMTPEKLAEQETRINEARKLALALPPGTQGFGSIAANFSDDQASRYRGGDVGWFDAPSQEITEHGTRNTEHAPYYRWPTEVVSAGLALTNKGEISPVVKTDKGFFIVSRLDSRPVSVTPFDQAKPAIQRRLLTEKREQTQQAFARQMQTFAPVQVFTQALVGIQYPASTVAKAQEELPPMLQGANISSNGKTPVN